MNILFLHGWQSTPGGLKPTQDHGHEVLNPHLPDDDFEALKIAQAEYSQGKLELSNRGSMTP